MDQGNLKSNSSLGLAVYIPLTLTVCFMALGWLMNHMGQQEVINQHGTGFSGVFPFFLMLTFWILAVTCLIITIAMLILRLSRKPKDTSEGQQIIKPSNKKNTIAVVLIFIVIGIVFAIYKYSTR